MKSPRQQGRREKRREYEENEGKNRRELEEIRGDGTEEQAGRRKE